MEKKKKREIYSFICGPGWLFPLIDVDHQKSLPSITFIKMAKKASMQKKKKQVERDNSVKGSRYNFLLGGVFLISIRNQKSQRFRWATAKKRDKSKWRRRDGWPSQTDTEPRVWLNWPFFFYFYLQRLSRTQQGTSFESGQDEDSGTSWTRRSSSTAKFQTTRTSTTGTGSGHPTLLSITSDDHVRNFLNLSSFPFVVWPFLGGLNLGSGWMDGPVLTLVMGSYWRQVIVGRGLVPLHLPLFSFHQNV